MTMREDSAAGWFFGLVLILSLPFYALAFTGAALPFAPALPISALGAVVPVIAAMILVTRQSGARAARGLFASAFRVRTIPHAGWVLVALGIMPVAFAVTGGVVWLSGTPVPTLQLLPLSAVMPASALFFIGAVGEEIGWQGYAYPALAGRHSALSAALIIGVVWALWHFIPFALMGRSATWILWHSLGMVLLRIIIVWLVVIAGQSILIAVLFHMMSNAVWGMFPDFDAWYDPKVMCLILLAPVMAIVGLWGQTTLRRFRYDWRRGDRDDRKS
jgi:uncharacterized protein